MSQSDSQKLIGTKNRRRRKKILFSFLWVVRAVIIIKGRTASRRPQNEKIKRGS